MAYDPTFLCSPLDQPSGLGGGYSPVPSGGDAQRPQPGPDARAAAFVDGQNLFHAAREAFGPHRPTCDVAALARAVCGTRAWSLAEVAAEVRTVASLTARPLRIASAFPVGPGTRSARGIDGTDWIQFDRTTYTACLAAPRGRERPRG